MNIVAVSLPPEILLSSTMISLINRFCLRGQKTDFHKVGRKGVPNTSTMYSQKTPMYLYRFIVTESTRLMCMSIKKVNSVFLVNFYTQNLYSINSDRHSNSFTVTVVTNVILDPLTQCLLFTENRSLLNCCQDRQFSVLILHTQTTVIPLHWHLDNPANRNRKCEWATRVREFQINENNTNNKMSKSGNVNPPCHHLKIYKIIEL